MVQELEDVLDNGAFKVGCKTAYNSREAAYMHSLLECMHSEQERFISYGKFQGVPHTLYHYL